MKKSLLLAALLLSSAAQAETWICESNGGVGLDRFGDTSDFTWLTSFIVDSDQGFKSIGSDYWSRDYYAGECVFTEFGNSGEQSLKCPDKNPAGLTTLTIILDEDQEETVFTWISSFWDGNIYSITGFCTKA